MHERVVVAVDARTSARARRAPRRRTARRSRPRRSPRSRPRTAGAGPRIEPLGISSASARSGRTASISAGRSPRPSTRQRARDGGQPRGRCVAARARGSASTASSPARRRRALCERARGRARPAPRGVVAHGLQRPALRARVGAGARRARAAASRCRRRAPSGEGRAAATVLDRAAGGLGDGDDVGRVRELGRSACARARSSGTPARRSASTAPRAALAPLVRRRCRGSAAAQAREALAAGVDRLEPRVAAGRCEVPARDAPRRAGRRPPSAPSTALRSTVAVELLDRVPARLGAGHVAGDPVGAHDVGRLGARARPRAARRTSGRAR